MVDQKNCEHDLEYTSETQKPYEEGGSYYLDIECSICGHKDREVYEFKGIEGDAN